MNEDEIRAKIHSNPQFVNAKRFNFDINQLEVKFPDGCPSHVIADVLMTSEEDLEAEMTKIVESLRTSMGVS